MIGMKRYDRYEDDVVWMLPQGSQNLSSIHTYQPPNVSLKVLCTPPIIPMLASGLATPADADAKASGSQL